MQSFTSFLRKPLIATICALLLGIIVTVIILLSLGYEPFGVFANLFSTVLSRPKYISNILIKSTPLIVIALGVSVAFKSSLFDIGAEGQFIAGSLTATIAGCVFNFHPALQIPIVMLAGILGGAICGLLEGFLKAKFGINEILTGIMVNWIMLYVSNFFVSMESVEGGISVAHRINESSFINILPEWKLSDEGLATLGDSWLADFLIKPDVNFGFIIAVVLAIVMVWFYKRTTVGYELRVVSSGRTNAEIAGINVKGKIILSLTIAGALCGLAGTLVVMGSEPHKVSQLAAFQGNGFNGMSVAFIAGSSPIGCLFIGLIFGALFYGAEGVQTMLGVPSDIINIMIGVAVFCMALLVIFPELANKLERRRNNR